MENYQKVAYIGLRNADGTFMLNVPLYVKVAELNSKGMTDSQEDIIHKIAETMTKRYEKQIREFLASKKEAINGTV